MIGFKALSLGPTWAIAAKNLSFTLHNNARRFTLADATALLRSGTRPSTLVTVQATLAISALPLESDMAVAFLTDFSRRRDTMDNRSAELADNGCGQ